MEKNINYASLTSAIVKPSRVKETYRTAFKALSGSETTGEIRDKKNLPQLNKDLRKADQEELLLQKFEKVDKIDESDAETDYYLLEFGEEIILLGKFKSKNTVTDHQTKGYGGHLEGQGNADIFTFINEDNNHEESLTYRKYGNFGKESLPDVYKLREGETLSENDKIIMKKSGIYQGGKRTRRQKKKQNKSKKNKLRKTNRKSKR